MGNDFMQKAHNIAHAEYPGDQCYVAAWKDAGRWDGSEPTVFDIHIATPSAEARTYDGPLPMLVSEHGHWEYRELGSDYNSDCRRGDGQIPMLSQAYNHMDSHNLNRELTNMIGDGVWCAVDYLAYDSGTMDMFRLPKFSYYFWQSQRDPDVLLNNIDSGPMIKIANYWTASSPSDVTVYSNCGQVKLYVNDSLVATQSPDNGTDVAFIAHPPFTFPSVGFSSGELKAEGYIAGQLVVTDIVNTSSSANKLDITFGAEKLAPDGDITFVYVSVLDASDELVTGASNSLTLQILSGPAVIIGPTQVNADAGIAGFLIRTTGTAGGISLRATASGLATSNADITSQ
jgi:beta-galactosidase